MEQKSHGGKRRGAGRKSVVDKKQQVTFYVPTKDILRFGSLDKMKQSVNDFIAKFGEAKIEVTKPSENAYDAPKIDFKQIQDEPLSFDKLRQQIAVPAATNDFIAQMDAAEDLEQLEVVGRKIKASGMSWREQQRYHAYGKLIANKKFL